MDLARAPRRTARKKGSGYENAVEGSGIQGRLPRAEMYPSPLINLFLTVKTYIPANIIMKNNFN